MCSYNSMATRLAFNILLTFTQMLMHMTVQGGLRGGGGGGGGCKNTVRETALKADSGRKKPCCTREMNLNQYHWCGCDRI